MRQIFTFLQHSLLFNIHCNSSHRSKHAEMIQGWHSLATSFMFTYVYCIGSLRPHSVPQEHNNCLRDQITCSSSPEYLCVTIAPALWEGNWNSFQMLWGWGYKHPSAVWLLGYGLRQFDCVLSVQPTFIQISMSHLLYYLSLKLSCSEGKVNLLQLHCFKPTTTFSCKATSVVSSPCS